MNSDQFLIRGHLWMVTRPVGAAVYDFDFRRFFDCRTPYEIPPGIAGVARVGAIADYDSFFHEWADQGIRLIHSPEDHTRCASLPEWYPLIEADTPRSRCYPEIPSLAELREHFDFPVFIKGARQTSKHQAAASIVRNPEDFAKAVEIFRTDPILHWQEFVCRELLELRPVSGGTEGKIRASYEFRTFWWRGEICGSGALLA